MQKMNKIKIGFLVNNLVVGGVSKVLIDLCNRLDSEKYEIHLLILSRQVEMLEYFSLDAHINIHFFDYKFIDDYSLKSYIKNSFDFNSTAIRAKEVLGQIKFLGLTILHFHTLPRQLVIGILAKQKNPQLKLVFTDHMMRISKDNYKLHQRILLAIAYRKLYREYHIVAVSKSVEMYIKTYQLNHPKKLLKTLENSIHISKYQRTNPIDEIKNNQLIYISRMNSQKGHACLINAWKKINKNVSDRLILVGPDESNGKFYKLANDDESIVFTGSISDLKPYLNESTIGVFPSQKEGLPLSLLEMMAFEIPIIVSDIAELTHLITNEKEGLHFKLDNEEDLKNKIEFLIQNKDIAIKMGLNARKKAEQICAENEPIRFHDQFYAQIVQSNENK